MRIRQSTPYLSSMIEDCAAGRMQPAAMQRPYVWIKDDVESLCDSILSNFPIGGFVLWEPGNKADLNKVSKGRLGPLTGPKAGDRGAVGLLLDGQNRMATLAWMMVKDFAGLPLFDGMSTEESSTWLAGQRLVLDSTEQRMMFVPAEEADIGFRLPAWSLLPFCDSGNHTINQLLRQRWNEWEKVGADSAEIEAFIKFHDQCTNAFRNAQTVVTLIENATAEEARNAFLRVCRVGVQMSQEDFDKAVNWTPDAA